VRYFDGNRKVYDSFRLGDGSGSGPNVVKFDLIEGFQVDGLPNAHRIEVGSPVPGILVACFSGVGVIKGHRVSALCWLIDCLRTADFDFQSVSALFEDALDISRISSEGVGSG
jgi:hypothetical protein